MPVQCNKDKVGPFCRWGQHGKKYYYIKGNSRSKQISISKAKKQGIAIHASGWVKK